MAKHTVKATLVKLGDSGVGVARLTPEAGSDGGGGKFVYFQPRDIENYQGETWGELASRGMRPGRALQLDVDLDAGGAVHQVSGVRIAGS